MVLQSKDADGVVHTIETVLSGFAMLAQSDLGLQCLVMVRLGFKIFFVNIKHDACCGPS